MVKVFTADTRTVAVSVDFAHASLFNTLAYATGHVLIPLLVVLSWLLKRKIEWGIEEYD